MLHVGSETLMGQVATLSNKSGQRRTILQKEILRFTTVIAVIAVGVAIFCLIIWGAWLRVDVRN